MSKFYITTAIDYPSAAPHMGHAYEKIVTDVYARWHRLKNDDVFFLTGTDEHGQKLQSAAEKAGLEPKEFVEKQSEKFKKFCELLNISNDDFIKTSETRHEMVAVEIFKKVFAKGDIYLDEYEGLYCTECETFYLEKDLVDGKCPIHGIEAKQVKEPSYFFKLSKYQDQLLEFIKKNKNFIHPKSRYNEILSRLKEPLKDLSVSRSTFKWGIPLPNDPEHIIYVWFDALINYLSGIEYGKDKFRKYWPADIHVIGKDIAWFHTVIWPCMLFAAGIEPPKQVYVHGFINDEHGEKMSKAKGNVIDPLEVIKKYGSDVLKYFMIRSIPSGSDGNFSEKQLVERYNTELANDLGNLISRATKIVEKFGELKNENFKQDLFFDEQIDSADKLMGFLEHNKSLDEIWKIVNKINAYMNEKAPWKIQDEKELKEVMYNVLESIRIVNILLSAFIPKTTEKIRNQLGLTEQTFKEISFGIGSFKIGERETLFPKIEYQEKELFPLDLRVGKVLSVEEHPAADRLYILKVDVGEERQLVAGLREHLTPEELIGKNIVVLYNLKPAKLRGYESKGMVLAAQKGDKLVVLTANDSPGSKVSVDGYETKESRIEFKDFEKVKLQVLGKKVLFDNKVLATSKVEIEADIEDGAQIS
ncbi:methionine--tRNA ligase [Nanoarchaeota archaeon]